MERESDGLRMSFTHGTQSGYKKHRCHCNLCRIAGQGKACTQCGAGHGCAGDLCKRCKSPRVTGACVRCGAEFVGHRASQRFCSASCMTAGASRKNRTCEQCGGLFTASNAKQATCSRECARQLAASRRPPKAPPQERAPRSRVYFPLCTGCGSVFAARSARASWCSYRCRVVDAGARAKSLYALACDMKSPGEAHMWRGVLIGYLVERDGRRCAICRRVVSLDVPSGPRGNRRGPSVDHVIPRSLGGRDDLANLRLTHWGCNQQRGNRGGFEQLALVG